MTSIPLWEMVVLALMTIGIWESVKWVVWTCTIQVVHAVPYSVVVTINGQKYGVAAGILLSYRDIADLAGFKSPTQPSMTLRESHSGRIMHPGESVTPRPGMVFNVADTSNA